jgi:hypothetical protein
MSEVVKIYGLDFALINKVDGVGVQYINKFISNAEPPGPPVTEDFQRINNRSAILQYYPGASWAEARDASVATTNEPNWTTPAVGNDGGWYIYRPFLAFNIAAIPTGASISAAEWRFTTSSPGAVVVVCEGKQSNPIVSADYDQFGTVKFSADHTIVNGANIIALNAAGLAFLQAAVVGGGGAALFLLREEPHDYDNVSGTGLADWAESSNVLRITYSS